MNRNLCDELKTQALKMENELVSRNIYRSLSERVVTLNALYDLGLHPMDTIQILLDRGWTQEEISEAATIMMEYIHD